MTADPKSVEELLHEGAEILRTEGAKEVYVFGSMASGTARDDSDVDIAISGLPPERFFPVMARLASLFRRPIDLVDLDDVAPFTNYLKTKEGALRRVA